MIEAAKQYKRAVVIGGGLLGLEAARGLLNLNMEVSVVHNFKHLMNRQLDEAAARMLQIELEGQGMKFLLERHTDSILGKERVTGLKFKDGSEVKADLVVMAVGIRPNISLAKQSGIEINQGIVVNDHMETNIPNIYSVGECAEHRGVAYGLVAPLWEQGTELAKRLAGTPSAGYKGSVVSTKLKVSGVNVFSAGQFLDTPGTRAFKVQDDFDGVYKKIVVQNGKLIGAVLFGDTSDGAKLFSMIRSGEDVSGKEKEIILGSQSTSKSGSGVDFAASMSNDEIVCGCNGVSKGTILKAIDENGCSNVNDVKYCTKATGSCGGCKPLVTDLLTFALGADGVTSVKEGICSCTALVRDEVVEAIRSMRLTTSKEVMNVLEWKNPEGCSKCRPALNYYLGMIWPEQHEDEKESRFVNERNHGNIQKDSTYSVIPRIHGGVTTAEDLKKIADVAVKYNVETVKITGAQRIGLYGIKKEDLPQVWEELDMTSGFAYGKSLRAVKTCVGNTWCRFGTQDAMGMGIELEKRLERLSTPAKTKVAVSGCPRNCAEATIKDLGVVAIDGGWEIYVGGNAGNDVRPAELLVKVKTDEEVIEWTLSYFQFYRENANYNERTAKWIDRVGLDAVKKGLETAEDRFALKERYELSASLTKDPWAEIIEQKRLNKNYKGLEPLEITSV
jgi:nitrite reductase (NADH) large subunit